MLGLVGKINEGYFRETNFLLLYNAPSREGVRYK